MYNLFFWPTLYNHDVDNFTGGFLFYVWLYGLGDRWIQKLLVAAEKVLYFEILNVSSIPLGRNDLAAEDRTGIRYSRVPWKLPAMVI